MKSYKVLMAQPAVEDLQSIAVYIVNELKEPSTAKRLVGRIKEAIINLSEMPGRYSLVADERLAMQKIRKMIVDNYIVFYVVSEKAVTVTVVRILFLFSRRDWLNLL